MAAAERREALAVRNVSVSLGGRLVLDNVDFQLAEGEFCGLIGANGSGKTTLLRTILGFENPATGSVRVSGAHGKISIGYVPQKIQFDASVPMRARDFVQLGLDGHRLGLPLPSRKRDEAVAAALRSVGAETFSDQRIGNLSGGQQQRLVIAHALVRRPRLLLLDEPIANLDLRSAAEIVRLLREISTDMKIAVLLSAHDINPLLPVMDRIVYLAAGRAAAGVTDDVVRTHVLSKLYGYHIDVIKVHGRIIVVAADSGVDALDALEKEPVHVAPL